MTTLIFILLMITAILLMFIIVSNFGNAVVILRGGSSSEEFIQGEIELSDLSTRISRTSGSSARESGTSGQDNGASVSDLSTGSPDYKGMNADITVGVYGDAEICTMFMSQMEVMKQTYKEVSTLSADDEFTLLIIDGSLLNGDADAEIIEELCRNGTSVFLTSLPEHVSEKLMTVCGIKRVGKKRTWPGLRVSSDLLSGYLIEEPDYEVEGVSVELDPGTKVYASALPLGYDDIDNDDLPHLFWRHIPYEDSGSVYVCCGSFGMSETACAFLPSILSELCGNYIYGVINAYCVAADGFPFGVNAENENWQRFYSRDKSSIALDMLQPQYDRYSITYGAEISYFTDDYDIFMTTSDSSLLYFKNAAESDNGKLFERKDGEMLIGNVATFDTWQPSFSFIDNGGTRLKLPVSFTYTVDNHEPDNFAVPGYVLGIGFYSVLFDVDDFLEYDGEKEVWSEYCSDQETVLGIHERDYGYLERVTADEAAQRLYNLLVADVETVYGENSVTVKNADGLSFMLRTDMKEMKITGGAMEQAADDIYLIRAESDEVIITGEALK